MAHLRGDEEDDGPDYATRPDLAPPDSVWNEGTGGWDASEPAPSPLLSPPTQDTPWLEGGTDRPREILGPGRGTPTRPPDIRERSSSTRPSPDSSEDSGYSPSRPKTPTPVASQSPQPFSPMAPLMDPGAVSVAMRAPSIPQPTSPSQFGGDAGQGGMFGAAGGLLGGGLGVSGRDDSFGDTEEDPLDAIIRMLLNGQA